VPLGISSDLPIESNLQPPVKIGGLRIPYVKQVTATLSATLAGGELYTLSWLDPVDVPGLSHFLIFASNLYDQQLEPVLVGATRRAPGHVLLQVPSTRTVIFYVQTVLSNGFTTDLAKSPSVTVSAQASSAPSTRTRVAVFNDAVVAVSGAPSNATYDSVNVVTLPGAAGSSVNFWLRVPDDATVANTLTVQLTYRLSGAPGVTNNKIKLLATFKVMNTLYTETAGDTITAANDTNWARAVGSNNILAGGLFAKNDLVQMTLRRDTTVANNTTSDFGIAEIDLLYSSDA